MTPGDLGQLLARLPLRAAMQNALGQAANRLDEAVRAALSEPPGGDHEEPWLQTGALRASISHDAEGLTAIVGSDSAIAVFQEEGTANLPPRPLLAPVAARMGTAIAESIGAAMAATIAGRNN